MLAIPILMVLPVSCTRLSIIPVTFLEILLSYPNVFFQIPFITFHPSSSDSFHRIYSLRFFFHLIPLISSRIHYTAFQVFSVIFQFFSLQFLLSQLWLFLFRVFFPEMFQFVFFFHIPSFPFCIYSGHRVFESVFMELSTRVY